MNAGPTDAERVERRYQNGRDDLCLPSRSLGEGSCRPNSRGGTSPPVGQTTPRGMPRRPHGLHAFLRRGVSERRRAASYFPLTGTRPARGKTLSPLERFARELNTCCLGTCGRHDRPSYQSPVVRPFFAELRIQIIPHSSLVRAVAIIPYSRLDRQRDSYKYHNCPLRMYWRGDRGQIHGLLAGQLVSLQASAGREKTRRLSPARLR